MVCLLQGISFLISALSAPKMSCRAMDHEQQSIRSQSTDPPSRPATSLSRLSVLYQYHNAPEVAPAHGLEHDDTIYPSSDKYPVIDHKGPLPYKLGYGDGAKPPRILFGMKVKTFVIVAVVMVCILVGASVGGAVGGRNMRGGNNTGVDGDSSTTITPTSSATARQQTISAGSGSSSKPTAAAASSSTTGAAEATPTFSPLSDCPSSQDTNYTSVYSSSSASSSSSSSTSGSDGQTFTKYCNVASPLVTSSGASGPSVANLTEAFVYTFDDCIEICASYNFYAGGRNCSVAVYDFGGLDYDGSGSGEKRRADCWIAEVEGLDGMSGLGEMEGVAVAVLV